tara:strand:- start:3105 stop:5141 length:2037 start_codon:yes stop_codon:yes gene_type:complete
MTSKDNLFKEAQKVINELTNELNSDDLKVRVIADGEIRSVKAQEARSEASKLESNVKDLEDKVAQTEEWLAEVSKKTSTGATARFSYNDLNEGYREIWGRDLPGWRKTSEDERNERLDDAAKNKLFKSTTKKINTSKNQIEEKNLRIVNLNEEADENDAEVADRREVLERRLSNAPDLNSANEKDVVYWMVGDRSFSNDLRFADRARKSIEGIDVDTGLTTRKGGQRQIENLLDEAEQVAETQPLAGELGGRDTIRPESDVLSDSELVREGLETDEVETGPGAQEPPTNEITDITSDPMQTGLEEGLAAQRDRIEQARGQDRVIDPRQAVPEFGEFPITGGGGDGGTPLPETYQDELDAIADALGITGGFGANFFLDRDDMMITHPVTKEKVNILEYIMTEELTGGKEVEELLEQTQWWAETDRQMRAFDLEWNRLGDGTGIPNTSQLGYIQPTINTVKTQLTKLGVELDDKVVNAIAKSAARLQLTGRQLREHLSDLDGFEGFDFDALVASQEEGLLGTYRDDIQKEASKWMISLGDDIDAETMNNMIESFYEGGGTQDDIDMASTYFANQAKALYPTLAPIIDQGISLSTYFLPYKQRVQNLLERQIDFLGADHGLFDKIISYTGGGEGIPRVATFSEIDRMIKSDRSSGYWETTQAANKSRSLADTVGRMFGAVA